MSDEQLTKFRLSPQQTRLWLAAAPAPDARAQAVVSLGDGVEAQRLKAALEQVIERHEILRTWFAKVAGLRAPLQAVSEDVLLDWSEEEGGVQEIAARQLRDPIELGAAPLLRATLVSSESGPAALVVTTSALIADAGTLAALVDELDVVLSSGELPPEPLQYADYAEWQLELAEADDDEAVVAGRFWSAQATDEVAPARLPFARRDDSDSSFRPEYVTLATPQGSSRDLLLAALAVALSRFSGESDLVIGLVADGRDDEELASALGPFARPLPVRLVVDNESSFAVLEASARDAAEAALEHGDHFALADGEPAPAYQLEWRVPSASEGPLTLSGLTVEGEAWALKLIAGPTTAEIAFDPRAFARADIEHFTAALAVLLQDAVARPQTKAGGLELLSSEMRQQLDGWNVTEVDFPADATIHELVEGNAARVPDAPAVTSGDVTLSYAELNAKANKLGRVLRERGIGADDRVGVLLERSTDAAVAMLGALKSGAAYVPLSVDHPAARIAAQVAAAEASVVVTKEGFLGALESTDTEPIVLDRDSDALAAQKAGNLEPVSGPGNLAYVIFTSGSTGIPKGVGVEHRSLVNYAHALATTVGAFEQPLSFALVSSLATDLGNTSVYPALISGGCLDVIPDAAAMDGALMARQAAERPYDVLKVSPSQLTALLAGDPEGTVLPRRVLVCGGEALSWDLVERVRALAGCAIVNHYGPTETTVGSLTLDLTGAPESAERPATVPIGRPIANTKAYILDAAERRLPVGAAGELCIGGAGVARGYISQPEETAKRFIEMEGARIYRTGDRVRQLPDGNIEFLGRVDDEVKVRGFRVNPGEVVATLAQHPDVDQAVVVPRVDASGSQTLVAYFVARESEPTVEQLRELLGQRLPDHMVPTAFVPLAALPLTANGKVDKRALPAPDYGRPELGSDYVEPRTETERTIAEYWTEVLGVDRVGINDDFFELGGHSLLATQVIAWIRSTLGTQLPLHIMFEAPTVAGLTEAIEREGAEADDDMVALLDELEGLSDEEVQRLLADRGETSGGAGAGG